MPLHRPSADLLPPVDIPLLQPPIPDDVEGADGGIGLRHIEHPLLVHMARPENTPPGTVFELYWGDPQWPVARNFIRDDDEDLTRIPFIVPEDNIFESWADPVYAKVIRKGGDGDETARLRLRVNLQRPGGRDPDDEMPGHQRLVYELPLDVLIDGVDDARAELGVEIVFRRWENMAPYDLLILVWGSERIEHRVQPEEVNSDIRLTVDHATIGDAGNGEAIPVGFQVVGPTGNYPDEWARWSAITWVDVYLDTERPEAPWLTFPETERDIELEQLGGQGVRVGARVSSADARAYSVVTLVWAGTDNEGVAVPHLESQNLSGGKAYYFTIDHALVAALARGTAYIYYLLQGDGLPEKRSYNRHLRILGSASPVKFPRPRMPEAAGEGRVVFLSPLDAQTGATVRVGYQPMYTTDRIQVTMVSLFGADSPVIAAKNGLADGVVTFAIPASAIAANIRNAASGMFLLTYEVTRAGEIKPSETQYVSVTRIDNVIEDDVLGQTVIKINEANQTTKVLDLSAVTEGGTVRVGTWPFITLNYPVWLHFSGQNSDNSPRNVMFWDGANGAAVNALWLNAGQVEARVDYSTFAGFHGRLTMQFKAGFRPDAAEADAIVFPPVTYVVRR